MTADHVIKLPVKAIAAELRQYAARQVFTTRRDAVDQVDVHLQVLCDGTWTLRYGDVDHAGQPGAWGHDSIPTQPRGGKPRFDSLAMARWLIGQCADMAAEVFPEGATDSVRFYSLRGCDYRVIMSSHFAGQVFAVHKRAKDGQFRKCSAQATHYLKRQVASELVAG